MGKSSWLFFLCLLCTMSGIVAAQQRRLVVLQPMSAVGYRPFTTESHLWYWSSVDGARLAYLAQVAGGQVLVADGIPSPKYQSVEWYTIGFGPSGNRVIYAARRGGQVRLVVDGQEGQPFAWIEPPVFSSDGAHMAYIARSADRQYRVVSDGKPGPIYSTIWGLHYCPDGRLVYSARRKEKECYAVIAGQQRGPYAEVFGDIVCSPDGKHLAYWVNHSTEELQRTLVLDGVEGSTYAGETEWLTFSPDSQHYAYTATYDGKRRLLLDSKELAAYAGHPYISPPLFSPDSVHIISTVRVNNRDRLLVDGKEMATVTSIMDVQFCGNRLVYRLVEGKRERVVVGDTVYPWRMESASWPNDVHDLWIACYMGRWRTFYGGTEGEPDNFTRGVCCSPDAAHWALPTIIDRRQTMLYDGNVGPRYRAIGVPFFSPNSKRLAYPVYAGTRFAMVVDGRRGALYRSVGSPAFSPDSRRVAYSAYTRQTASVVIDGRAGMTFNEILGKGYLWNGQQVTFDAPDRLHYLARRGRGLYYVREYLLPATAPDTFTYFEGEYISKPRQQVRQTEQHAVQGGHMPWRSDLLSVAQVMSMPLLPAIPPGKTPTIRETPHGASHDVRVAAGRWEAVFRQVSATHSRAAVDVMVNGRRWYRLTLERPFRDWWYVTGIATIPVG